MSEYQYYEFRSIDRPLNEKQMAELRRLSTRAEITPTSFTNVYHWGDFKGEPRKLMHEYFDAFVYVANWGTHRLMFRIPGNLLDAETARAYEHEETLSVDARKDHLVLDFGTPEDEPDDDLEEGEGWMPSLISIRADLMRGDHRALYLGWLAGVQTQAGYDEDEEDIDGEELEPPVPPGLGKLSGPLRELADFLRIDDELIEVAAAGSTGEAPAGPSRDDMAKWVKSLPAVIKDDALVRFLAEEGDLALRAELLAHVPRRYPAQGKAQVLRGAADGRATARGPERPGRGEETQGFRAEGQGEGEAGTRAGRGAEQVSRRAGGQGRQDLAGDRRPHRHQGAQEL